MADLQAMLGERTPPKILRKSYFVAMQNLCFTTKRSLVEWDLFSDLGAREQIWSRG